MSAITSERLRLAIQMMSGTLAGDCDGRVLLAAAERLLASLSGGGGQGAMTNERRAEVLTALDAERAVDPAFYDGLGGFDIGMFERGPFTTMTYSELRALLNSDARLATAVNWIGRLQWGHYIECLVCMMPEPNHSDDCELGAFLAGPATPAAKGDEYCERGLHYTDDGYCTACGKPAPAPADAQGTTTEEGDTR